MPRTPEGAPDVPRSFVHTVRLTIKNFNIENCTFIEPFAGGASVALSLLLSGFVDRIVINDYDKAIYSFWRVVKNEPDALIDLIDKTPISISEWYRQKEIYVSSRCYSLELSFATLFLNRTNRSGILNAGPIGGYAQAGEWKLDVRFNKKTLVEKILTIAGQRDRISIYNKDIAKFLEGYSSRFSGDLFFYFDPPYFDKGHRLYKNFFAPKDHLKTHDLIVRCVDSPWLITYDDVSEIAEIYSGHGMRRFDWTYSAANKGAASELAIFSDINACPTQSQLQENKVKINLRDCC